MGTPPSASCRSCARRFSAGGCVERIRRLCNPIRDYAWGSHDALARLTGRAYPTAAPEAELWMGAHASAPSLVEADAGPVSLLEWIARDPVAVLGADVAARFGGELPFLFKVLAPAQALSIQTHPNAAQARAGFERENAAGVPLAAPERNYRDPNPKPELISAPLTVSEATVRTHVASILEKLDLRDRV